MTSVATVAGHLPLVLAAGPGAGARNSIGTVLVTGMAIGTAFTLFVVPAIYMLVARNRVAIAETAELEATQPELTFPGSGIRIAATQEIASAVPEDQTITDNFATALNRRGVSGTSAS
jgi:hypothetical protein